MGAVKDAILGQLKQQWLLEVRKQYKETPDKVKNADVTKNAKDIYNNVTVKMMCKSQGITEADIKEVLQVIKDAVIKENS